ncbi:chymotrypsin BI-like [Neocloeon triangulifer]|uniref:chymotrypsin BI-like n=1 Tax=Neocloeon triangulifer TaxID=2078957 RepID=UPI00286F7D41|nr:chymotrypsin BI-like [Neocloeon triangulifer]
MGKGIVLLLALVVQVVLGALGNGDVYIRVKSKERTLPRIYEKLSASQWTKLINTNQPSADNPNANPIIQPNVAGTASAFSKQAGGSLASLGQFPWQALIYIDSAVLCGGSLILSQWVLTAAHCTGRSYDVILGTISQSLLTPGYLRFTSTVNYTHEQYNDTNLNNDIALIKLPSSVSFTASVSPVKLPSLYDATKNLTGTLATVSGFVSSSSSRDLKYTQVTVISYQSCASYFGSSFVASSIICSKQIDTSICQGDIGGPLVYIDSNKTWVQIGVISFGSSSGCIAGFTRVSSFLGWMSGKIGQDLSGTTTINGGISPTSTLVATSSSASSANTPTIASTEDSSSTSQTLSVTRIPTTTKTSTSKTTTATKSTQKPTTTTKTTTQKPTTTAKTSTQKITTTLKTATRKTTNRLAQNPQK